MGLQGKVSVLSNYNDTWLKNPFIFGVSRVVSYNDATTQAVSEEDVYTLTTVPSNELWIVTSFGVVNNGGAEQYFGLVEYKSATNYLLGQIYKKDSYHLGASQLMAIVEPDSVLKVMFGFGRASQDYEFSIGGYAMKIEETG